MSDTNKIIEFPKHKVVREVPNEVVEERNRRSEQKTADSIVDDLTGIIVTELDNYCIDVTSKKFTKDFVLVMDSLKAAVYRSFGIEHHLHDFVDNNVTLIEGDFSGLTKEEVQEKIETIIAGISTDEESEELDETPVE